MANRKDVHFTLKGRDYVCDHQMVKDFMFGAKILSIRKYYVSIYGRRYPVKQIVSAITGKDLSEFGSVDAVPLLRRLGFKIHRLKE